ncbi:MAG: hypothetical protein ING75_09485 [Rhodocyclaceae bacterium]|nr:hypothetical protein [Rhodocyclaceae bacterium]
MDAATQPATALLGTISAMSSFLLNYAVALAATGTLAMALVEAWKAIFRSREYFNMNLVYEWIATAAPPSSPDGFHDKVFSQLIHLTTGKPLVEGRALGSIARPRLYKRVLIQSEYVLFALDIDRLMGQIQSAADAAISNPQRFPELYEFLTRNALGDDAPAWKKSAAKPRPENASPEEIKAIADRFAMLNKFVKRELDGLQLRANYAWARWNQGFSVSMGTAILFGSLLYTHSTGDSFGAFALVKIFILSLVGGMIAPVAKDLVSALQKVKSGG